MVVSVTRFLIDHMSLEDICMHDLQLPNVTEPETDCRHEAHVVAYCVKALELI